MLLSSSEIAWYWTRSAGKSHQTILVLLQELEDMIYKLENEKEKDIIIDHRFYRNIIGSKGENIREIREMFNQVQITFPGQGKLFLGALPCLCGVTTTTTTTTTSVASNLDAYHDTSFSYIKIVFVSDFFYEHFNSFY